MRTFFHLLLPVVVLIASQVPTSLGDTMCEVCACTNGSRNGQVVFLQVQCPFSKVKTFNGFRNGNLRNIEIQRLRITGPFGNETLPEGLFQDVFIGALDLRGLLCYTALLGILIEV